MQASRSKTPFAIEAGKKESATPGTRKKKKARQTTLAVGLTVIASLSVQRWPHWFMNLQVDTGKAQTGRFDGSTLKSWESD